MHTRDTPLIALTVAIAAVMIIALWYSPWPSPCYHDDQKVISSASPNTAYYKCDEKDSDWWGVRIAAVVGAIGFLQLIMFYRQWSVMHQSLGDTKKAADAALSNALATREQVEASINSERARFFLKDSTLHNANVLYNPTPHFNYAFINYGRSTAILLEFSIECGLEEVPLPHPPVYSQTARRTAHNGIGANSYFGAQEGGLQFPPCVGAPLTPAQFEGVRAGQALYAIKGYIRFKDVFGATYMQRFAFASFLNGDALQGLMEPGYNDETREGV